jgi:hypothetical protein
VRDRDGTREVGDEEEAGLERCDEQRVPSLVLERQLAAELTDARVELLAGEVDLADARVD